MFKDEVENSRENVRARKKIVKIKRSRSKLRKGSRGRWTRFEMKYEMVPIHNKILTLVELILCKKIVKSDTIPIRIKGRSGKGCRDGFKIFAMENT
ncbi:MAG: hypothetical protein ACJ0QU_04825 [Halobacteriales archaeon]